MLEILCKNLKILIINCIYKTNIYKILLLTICEIIALEIIFIVDFVFIKKENKNYYNYFYII
jgi:hypothetical protein